MAEQPQTAPTAIRFETHPSRYIHWDFKVDGAIARLAMNIKAEARSRP